MYAKDRQCTYNGTLRRGRKPIVAVEKQYKYYICVSDRERARACALVWVRTCAFARDALLIQHASRIWLHHVFQHYLLNDTISGKTLLNIKYVMIFSTTFI